MSAVTAVAESVRGGEFCVRMHAVPETGAPVVEMPKGHVVGGTRRTT